ncbi:MAG: hypothetical protein IT443_00430 [Phycisphaeraceae bacterium]|nr:hypothetical protein [Phycisphaeraceae bacterium]
MNAQKVIKIRWEKSGNDCFDNDSDQANQVIAAAATIAWWAAWGVWG